MARGLKRIKIMKFRQLFENDLITLSEIPLHIQELGDVFAVVRDALHPERSVYVVNNNGWKTYTVIDGTPKEYNPLINSDNPKKLLMTVARDFTKPEIKYIVK